MVSLGSKADTQCRWGSGIRYDKKKNVSTLHSAPTGTGFVGGWLHAHTNNYRHFPNTHTDLHPHAAIHTYASAHKHPQLYYWSCTGGASYEVCTPHQKDTSDISDRSQMMMHRDLLPLQRQNKRTDMKEKSINIRHLIKHFLSAEFTTKVFIFFSLTWQNKKNTIIQSHDWLRWMAAIHYLRMGLMLQKCKGNWVQYYQ